MPKKQTESMNGAMKFFTAGCVAELYLLIIRRFYVNGNINEVIAWDSYLNVFAWIGVAILALGVALSFAWNRDKKRIIGWFVAGSGAFLAVSSFLVHWNMSTLTLLSVVVPVVMLLGIVWSLYDKECAMSLTILAASLIVLWVLYRAGSSMYTGIYVKVAAGLYLLLLGGIALWLKRGNLQKMVDANMDSTPVYLACGISAVALAVAFVGSTVAYYAMWTLAVVVFGLAVYYTVQQL